MAAGESKDDLLAAAVAAGKSHVQAADAAGLSVRTVARRVKEPAFLERVRKCDAG